MAADTVRLVAESDYRWRIDRIGSMRVPGIEDGGVLPGADPGAVSRQAMARGLHQLGSLGSGNHFLELQMVDRVIDPATAEGMGLHHGQICVMIHCGSRGLGHQVCADHVQVMEQAMPRYGIQVPGPQLACVPWLSPKGQTYQAAMAAAANYARANRQLLAAAARAAFARVVGTDRLELVYDVSHNLAKLETHDVQGAPRRLCVHRKGATRALPPGHLDLPAELAAVGQPVLVPGSMGTASYVLVGEPSNDAFLSTCHGAGRVMSRMAADSLSPSHPGDVDAHEGRDGLLQAGRHIRSPGVEDDVGGVRSAAVTAGAVVSRLLVTSGRTSVGYFQRRRAPTSSCA